MHKERIAGQGRVTLYSYEDLKISEGSNLKIAVGRVGYPRKKEIVDVEFKGLEGDLAVFRMKDFGKHEFKFPKTQDVVLFS